MTWYVYILECKDNTLYTGITNDLDARLKKHNLGTASKYTRSRVPVKLVYVEMAIDRSQASKREYELKQLSRKSKLKIIEHYQQTKE